MDASDPGQDDPMRANARVEDVEPRGAIVNDVRADPDAFRRLFDAHHAFIWRSLLHLGVHDASVDDAVQEVFLVVHRRLPSYDESLPFRAWLWGIARNVAHNQKRTVHRDARRREALATNAVDSPEVSLDRARDFRSVREIVMTMDDGLRDVLVLADVEGLTAPEIAVALGANVNTIYSRLRIARQRFALAARRRGMTPGGTNDG